MMLMERMKEESKNETRRPKTSNASGKQAFKSIVKSKVISDLYGSFKSQIPVIPDAGW